MPKRIPLPVLILPALLLFALLAWRLSFFCDDAFISFRYARNLALGNGLRYNLTLGAPVEGYSNFLWVAWLALFERFGLDLALWSRLSSALSGLVLVAWITLHARKRFELGAAGAVATGLFAASLPPMALWATGGLATMPTALFVFGAYERLLGDPERPRGIQAGIFAVLTGLIRADGTVWMIMLLGAAGVCWLLQGRAQPLGRAIVQVALILVVGVGAHIAWRYSYYGEWLPNTARVKAGFTMNRLLRGVDYVFAWLLIVPAAVLVMLLALRRWKRGLQGVWIPSAVMLLGTLSYAAYVGGDFMPMGRFLFPAISFVPLLFAAAWQRLTPEAAAVTPLAILLTASCLASNVLACFDLNLVPASVRSRFHFRQDRPWQSEMEMRGSMYEFALLWQQQGRALARVVEPGESMPLGGMGVIGYYSGLEVFDTYGLVTPSVIGATEPHEVSSPGHDLRVSIEFFQDQHPTYAGNLFAPIGSPLDHGLPEHWENRPMSRQVTIEQHALPPDQGFPPGQELRLLRYHRWD